MKNSFFINVVLLLSMLTIATGCEKDTEPENFPPVLTTNAAQDIYRQGATLSGSIKVGKNIIVEECGILISNYESMAEPTEYKADVADDGTFSVKVSGLNDGATYFYCSYAKSGAKYGAGALYAKGDVKSFTTAPNANPVLGNTVVSNISYTSLNVSAEILDDGGEDIVSALFYYKQTDGDIDADKLIETKDAIVLASISGTTMTAEITGLQSGRRYAICPVAGKSHGDVVYATTTQSSETIVSTAVVDSTTRIASAEILNEGTSGVKEVGFCYSTENKNPTLSHYKEVATLMSNKLFSATLTGINPEIEKIYYVKAYVIENNGTVRYSEKSTELHISNSDKLTVLSEATIDSKTLTATAKIEAYGKLGVKEVGFCYSRDSEMPTISDKKVTAKQNGDQISGTLTDISLDQTYYVRAFAIEDNGNVVYSERSTELYISDSGNDGPGDDNPFPDIK